MPKIVDLDDIVIKWAWTFMEKGRHIFRGLTFDDLKFDINWDRVRFIASEPVYTDEHSLAIPNSQVVFRSVFENTTANLQEHSFQAERCTVATSKTTMTKGFKKGLRLGLKLAVPSKIIAATAGFGKDWTLETGEESTHEEYIKWSINSSIRVSEKHRMVAELSVKEQQYTAKFKTSVRIRGRVVVMVTSQFNSCQQCVEQDFVDIIKEAAITDKHFAIEEAEEFVKWHISGKCQFQYGVEQHIHLYECPIERL